MCVVCSPSAVRYRIPYVLVLALKTIANVHNDVTSRCIAHCRRVNIVDASIVCLEYAPDILGRVEVLLLRSFARGRVVGGDGRLRRKKREERK